DYSNCLWFILHYFKQYITEILFDFVQTYLNIAYRMVMLLLQLKQETENLVNKNFNTLLIKKWLRLLMRFVYLLNETLFHNPNTIYQLYVDGLYYSHLPYFELYA